MLWAESASPGALLSGIGLAVPRGSIDSRENLIVGAFHESRDWLDSVVGELIDKVAELAPYSER